MNEVGPYISPHAFVRASVKRRPFDYMAYLEVISTGDGLLKAQYRESYSLFQHRLTIVVALGSLLHEDEHNTEEKIEKMRYFSHAFDTLLNLVNLGHATSLLGEKETILQELLPRFMRELDCEMVGRLK